MRPLPANVPPQVLRCAPPSIGDSRTQSGSRGNAPLQESGCPGSRIARRCRGSDQQLGTRAKPPPSAGRHSQSVPGAVFPCELPKAFGAGFRHKPGDPARPLGKMSPPRPGDCLPIRDAATPMPVAPMVPPVDAMPAPSAALTHQFDRRCGAEFRWGRVDRREGGGSCRHGGKRHQAGECRSY